MSSIQHLCYLVFWLMVPNFSASQVVVQRGTVALTGTDARVTVNSNFVNRGTTIQQGALALQGDLLNYATYQATEGFILLNGLDQGIYTDSMTLKGLHISNGNSKHLDGIMEITDRLTLEDGLLDVPETSRLIIAAQGKIPVYSAKSYVSGFLYHRGLGEKTYPIGDQKTCAPVILHDIQGESPVVGVSFEPREATPFWHQRVLSGSYLGATATVSFENTNVDYSHYQEQLQLFGIEGVNQSRVALGAAGVNVGSERVELSSQISTTLPWIMVGYTADPDQEDLFVPNAYSPGAAHPDDQRIKVYGRFISHNNFWFGIQDSWGRWVYQTTSLEEATREGWFDPSPVSSSLGLRYVVSGQFLSGATFHRSDIINRF